MIQLFEKLRALTLTVPIMVAALVGGMIVSAALPVLATDVEEQQVVDKAKMTLESFLADPSVALALKDLKPETKALFIVPQFTRGAVILGGAAGNGVLIVRNEKTGKWSEPVFYNMGSGSLGVQIGADVSEVIFVVRTQRGLEGFYRNDFKLGLDASLAVGQVGQGASRKGTPTDFVGYAKSKGAFLGFSAEGSSIAVSDESNAAYYGKSVRPTDIVVKGSVSNPKSADLRNAAAKF